MLVRPEEAEMHPSEVELDFLVEEAAEYAKNIKVRLLNMYKRTFCFLCENVMVQIKKYSLCKKHTIYENSIYLEY